MKKIEELSQRDVAKLESVKKMIACSPVFRQRLIVSIIKNVISNTASDDDEQKAALLLAEKKLCAPECSNSYRILCEVIVKHPENFDETLTRKARSFAKANKLTLDV